MPETKNLCAQIDLDLHRKITAAREQTGQTTSQYMTDLLTEYFEMKETGGNIAMTNNNTRTQAVQIVERKRVRPPFTLTAIKSRELEPFCIFFSQCNLVAHYPPYPNHSHHQGRSSLCRPYS